MADGAALFTRVFLDQVFFAPMFIACFFIGAGVLEGLDMATIREKLRAGYPSALAANYQLWPWVQLGNFYFVPLQYRLLVVNTGAFDICLIFAHIEVAIGWNSYLSLMNQQALSRPKPE
jgi:protein Mpv17